MTLRVLAGVRVIGRQKVARDQDSKKHILIDDVSNIIAFHFDSENGCCVDDIVEASLFILEGLNREVPCRENHIAINHLKDALSALDMRRRDRTIREVLGEKVQ